VSWYMTRVDELICARNRAGIFTNFRNVWIVLSGCTVRIAQQGKAFRNEISPRDFIFRSREFEQMEIDTLCTQTSGKQCSRMVKRVHNWCDALGLPADKVMNWKYRMRSRSLQQAHYRLRIRLSNRPRRAFGLGLPHRFRPAEHSAVSGKSMDYRPKDGSAPFVPHVIEPSFGVERAIMAVLTSAYTEDEVNGEKRTYLKLPAHLARSNCRIALLKNKPELVSKAREVYEMLKKNPRTGGRSLGRQRQHWQTLPRQDEIGTPNAW